MLIKIMLWAILLGSVIMGYFGYKTGSAENAAIGIGVLILAGFALFFLLKIFLHVGFLVVKILLFIGLIALIAISGIKGCQYLTGHGRQVNQKQVEEVQSLESEIAGKSLWGRAVSFFSFSQNGGRKPAPVIPSRNTTEQASLPQKQELPQKINGKVTAVMSGYLFKMGSHFIKLYGIDAPDPSQNCIDERGEEYNCGHTARLMLERLILGKKISCQIVGGDYKENYIATCKLHNIDIGAGMITAGWAIADRTASQVYIPYEEKAHKGKVGLWRGKFVAPWMARQNRAAKPKSKSKPGKKSEKGFWESLF